MWNIAFELGTITLVCGLCPNHSPNHLFLSPCPPQSPPRAQDVPKHLEIVHRHHGLQPIGRPRHDIPFNGDVPGGIQWIKLTRIGEKRSKDTNHNDISHRPEHCSCQDEAL
nr:hypothetical protein Iba_chr11aCG6990 [Ipomoea batatas]GMD51862.1 hypothetical protein Iba_chr11bCG6360 [Ipomoea batatas]